MLPGSPVPVQVERASRGTTPYISPVRLLARADEMFFLAEPRTPVMKPAYARVSEVCKLDGGGGSDALPGSALHAFDVKDCDRARLQPNPSPSSKIS